MRSRFFTFLLDLLFPRACIRCGVDGDWLCADCRNAIPKTLHEGTAWSLFRYHEAWVGKAIQELKYNGVAELADLFGSLIAERWHRTSGLTVSSRAYVTAIPLHARRERERGFNQSERIGRSLAHDLGLPFFPLLERTRKTQPQAKLDREQRLTNMKNAFRARSDALDGNANLVFPFETVILVDDVATTGATLDAAEEALRAMGVKNIVRVTVAYAPLLHQ